MRTSELRVWSVVVVASALAIGCSGDDTSPLGSGGAGGTADAGRGQGGTAGKGGATADAGSAGAAGLSTGGALAAGGTTNTQGIGGADASVDAALDGQTGSGGADAAPNGAGGSGGAEAGPFDASPDSSAAGGASGLDAQPQDAGEQADAEAAPPISCPTGCLKMSVPFALDAGAAAPDAGTAAAQNFGIDHIQTDLTGATVNLNLCVDGWTKGSVRAFLQGPCYLDYLEPLANYDCATGMHTVSLAIPGTCNMTPLATATRVGFTLGADRGSGTLKSPSSVYVDWIKVTAGDAGIDGGSVLLSLDFAPLPDGGSNLQGVVVGTYNPVAGSTATWVGP